VFGVYELKSCFRIKYKCRKMGIC